MTWIIAVILMVLSAITGFLVGIAYGQEHRE